MKAVASDYSTAQKKSVKPIMSCVYRHCPGAQKTILLHCVTKTMKL